MTTIIYEYEIPDPARPIPEDERGLLGPTGHLIPFIPSPIFSGHVAGRIIGEICSHVGTYGMGGPGFFGLRLDSEWLVIAIWGAAEWMTAQGRCLGDTFHQKYGRTSPWLAGDGELDKHVAGQRIRSIEVQRHSLCIVLDNAFDLTIEESSSHRPLLEGVKKPRTFAEHDDLRRAVFLAPTAEIWV